MGRGKREREKKAHNKKAFSIAHIQCTHTHYIGQEKKFYEIAVHKNNNQEKKKIFQAFLLKMLREKGQRQQLLTFPGFLNNSCHGGCRQWGGHFTLTVLSNERTIFGEFTCDANSKNQFKCLLHFAQAKTTTQHLHINK